MAASQFIYRKHDIPCVSVIHPFYGMARPGFAGCLPFGLMVSLRFIRAALLPGPRPAWRRPKCSRRAA